MASILCDVTLWLEHAKKVRALCEMISDPEEKEQMMVVAAGFDRIAELAKEQAIATKAMPPLDVSTCACVARAKKASTQECRLAGSARPPVPNYEQ